VSELADVLDALAHAVFSRDEGAARLAPLLDAWARAVGPLPAAADAAGAAEWHATRIDWALCDATPPGGVSGDTWAARVARGLVPGVPSSACPIALAGTVAGLFELHAARRPWLRDVTSGLCLQLLDPRPGMELGRGAPPLWDARVAFEGAAVRLVRPPVEHPRHLWSGTGSDRMLVGVPARALAEARRARLAWQRRGPASRR
jgi:hypothetical protein